MLSVAIPTFERALILEDCLARLSPELDRIAGDVEVIVSDNASTDDTFGVVAAAGELDHRIRYACMDENRGGYANFRNCVRLARGDLIVCLADDDTIIGEALNEHVRRMEAEPSLTAIYADSIAWDDQAKAELHRYFGLTEAVEFQNQPLELVNFVLEKMLPPEIGVFRRDALIRAQVPSSRMMPYHANLMRFAALGKVRFDPLAFYREHRIMRLGLERANTANMDMALNYIGDEQRLGLETMVLFALQDAGRDRLPDDWRANVHAAIDRMLHVRTTLEIDRACQRGDFILATELRRRQVLWSGPGDIQADVDRLVVPAAHQALAAYEGYDDPPSLAEMANAYRLGARVTIKAADDGEENLGYHGPKTRDRRAASPTAQDAPRQGRQSSLPAKPRRKAR